MNKLLDRIKKWCDLALDNYCFTSMYKYELADILNYITNLEQENKQLKEQLENDIDRYEDTISYQLGFDKGKEYMQQRIDKAIEFLHKNTMIGHCKEHYELLEILGDKENE